MIPTVGVRNYLDCRINAELFKKMAKKPRRPKKKRKEEGIKAGRAIKVEQNARRA
jgi:hypothetical protein